MSFAADTIQRVWEKGHIIPGHDPEVYRKDDCLAWIKRADYGNHESSLGWDIDHITPVGKGGSNQISNLRPLQWENNQAKGDGPTMRVVTAHGNGNVRVLG